jgi:hypothetical protein
MDDHCPYPAFLLKSFSMSDPSVAHPFAGVIKLHMSGLCGQSSLLVSLKHGGSGYLGAGWGLESAPADSTGQTTGPRFNKKKVYYTSLHSPCSYASVGRCTSSAPPNDFLCSTGPDLCLPAGESGHGSFPEISLQLCTFATLSSWLVWFGQIVEQKCVPAIWSLTLHIGCGALCRVDPVRRM